MSQLSTVGQWKQVRGWMRESGGQVENGNEQVWGMWLKGGTERQNVIGHSTNFTHDVQFSSI